MSKRTAAGLAAVLVWAVNKGLTFAGMPHLAPSIVWAISSACLMFAAYLTTEAASPGNKLAQQILAILAIVGAVGVQAVDTKAIPDVPDAPTVTTPAGPDVSNEAAPSVAPDVVGGISEATDAPATLLVHPDASPAAVPAASPVLTPDIIGAKPVTDPKTNEPSGAGQGLDTAGQ